MAKLEELIKELPPELRQEVEHFAEFLVETKLPPKQKKLRLEWAGALSAYRGKFTSLELQRKALEWWGD